ncbi:sodium:proton antiporter [Hyphobacterium sp.]|uniref:sodium:proton antiporter n=1 Tax=Hyphobacterium sp. TaxID=2004662 RepID=UPI003BA9C1A5
MIEIIAERFNFIVVIILMMTGLYAVIATGNLVKRLVGLSLFQTSVFLLFITTSKVFGGQPPILPYPLYSSEGNGYDSGGGDASPDAAYSAEETATAAAEAIYSNPLPHVLILTAIVVGVATLSVGLALVVRIRETYGSIEDDDINKADYAVDSAGRNT